MAKKINEQEQGFILGAESNVVESILPFLLDARINNGLATGFLDRIEKTKNLISETNDKGQASDWEYAGMELTNINITFRQADVDDLREYTYRSNIPTFVGKDGAIDNKIIKNLLTAQFQSLRHILNVYGIEEKTPLAMTPLMSAPERIRSWNEWIDKVEELLSGVVGRAKKTKMWIKLVADYKKGTFHTFPTWAGTGFLETVKKVDGSKEVKPSTLFFKADETIELSKKQTEKGAPASVKEKIGANLSPDIKGML